MSHLFLKHTLSQLVWATEQVTTVKKWFLVKGLLTPWCAQQIQFTGNLKASVKNNTTHLKGSLMNQNPQMTQFIWEGHWALVASLCCSQHSVMNLSGRLSVYWSVMEWKSSLFPKHFAVRNVIMARISSYMLYLHHLFKETLFRADWDAAITTCMFYPEVLQQWWFVLPVIQHRCTVWDLL